MSCRRSHPIRVGRETATPISNRRACANLRLWINTRRVRVRSTQKKNPTSEDAGFSCDSRSCFTRRPSLDRLNTVFTLSCQQPTVTAFQLAVPELGQHLHRGREPERRPELHIPELSAGRPEWEHSRSALSEHRLEHREHSWRQEPHNLASRDSTCCRSTLCTDPSSAD